MGFRANSFAKVWAVESTKPNITKVRLSTSRKNKQTGQYETDFSGYCSFVGNCAVAALKLREGDRIKLGDVDVSNRYDREAKREYTFYTVFGFEMADSNFSGSASASDAPAAVEENPVETDSNGLPF